MTSSRGRGKHLESFDGPELTAWLESEQGAVLVRQSGSHLHFRLPNGNMVGSLLHGFVPSPMARAVATQLGIPYFDLRKKLGKPVINTGKPKAKMATVTKVSYGRSDLLKVLVGLTDLLLDVEGAIRERDRDSVVYKDVFGFLSDARQALRCAIDRMKPGIRDQEVGS